MALLIIASVLNVVFIVLTGYFIKLIMYLDQGMRLLGDTGKLYLLIFMIAIPIVNLIALWTFYGKGKKQTKPLKDLIERIEKLESSQKTDFGKT